MKNQTKKKKIKHNKTKKINMEDDFYTYINKNWLKNYTIPLDQNSVNLFSILQKKIDFQLLEIVKKCEKNPKNIQEKNLVNLFKSCIIYNKPLAKQQLYYFIQTLNDLIQKKNIFEFITWMIQSGFKLPFQILVSNNIYNSKKNILNIVHGEFSFNNKNIYLKNNKVYKHYRKEFLLFLKIVFYIVFGKNHSFQVENILKVETEMAKYLYSSTEDNQLENKLNFYSVSHLHSSFHLDFSKIFHNLDIKYDNKVQVDNPRYLKNISNMFLHKWDSKEWKEYWIYQIIKVYSSLDKSINDVFFNFFDVILQDKKKRFPIKITCLSTINSYMNIYLNQLYLKNHKNEKEIKYCNSLAEKIKVVFKERLQQNTWLEKKTIEKALLKLSKINFVIGYKNKWKEEKEYDKLIFSINDKYGNYKKFIGIYLSNINKELNETNKNNVWVNNGVNLYDVNAYYNGMSNELIIPNAILQPPFLDLSKSFEYNLAFIGSTLGHELIHAFDDEGCKLDDLGNYDNWWTLTDKKEYEKKQKEIIIKYEKMAKLDNIHLDGKLSLGENIADIYGVLICEEVLEKELIQQNILGKDQISHFKQFYEYYSSSWRNKINNKSLHDRILNDVHSLSKYRVNGVLQNSKKFQSIYGLNEENNMFNNTFIEIW
jgi:putative endopeptidase